MPLFQQKQVLEGSPSTDISLGSQEKEHASLPAPSCSEGLCWTLGQGRVMQAEKEEASFWC